MNVLLVRPDTPKKSINLQSFMICEPLELEYDVSMLKSLDCVDEVDLIDMLLEKKELEYFLRQKKYDFVCMTCYITTIGVVKDYARRIKAFDKNIVTVVGGVHAEVVPSDLEDENIDFILWANGVETLKELVLGHETGLEGIPAGVYRPGRQKPEIVNGKLALPDRKITAKYRDSYNYIYHDKCATIKTSYGCPYKCSFCFCTRVCEYSVRALDNVMTELESIEEENVFIVDDDFLVSRERITDFCAELDRRGIRKHYIAFGRADFISKNEDMIILLHEHGFDAFFVGIESFKKDDLNDFSKQSSVEQNVKAINILESNGLQCYSGLIVGEDWVKEDFDTLINHLNSFEHPLVNIQPITPMPGTPLSDSYPYPIDTPRTAYECWDMAHVVFRPQKMKKSGYYYNIIRAYLKTSANAKQRKFIREKYGMKVYKRVKRGAQKIFFQYVQLMLSGK